MAKTPEELQDDKTRPAPEASKDSPPRLQPRWKAVHVDGSTLAQKVRVIPQEIFITS